MPLRHQSYTFFPYTTLFRSYTASSFASRSLEDIRAAAGTTSPLWFQFYMSKDDGINLNIIDIAERNGAKAIILTADATVGGNRRSEEHTSELQSRFDLVCRL